MKKQVLVLLVIFLGMCFLIAGEARSGEAELLLSPDDVMSYLNNLNESAEEIKASEDFEEYRGLSGKIKAELSMFWETCEKPKKNAQCISQEASILRDIHSYVTLSHDSVEQMISSLELPADLRYSLLKSARLQVSRSEPEEDNTIPSMQNIFGAEEGSHTLAVLQGLSEVFTPIPDHGPKLERALSERVVELEANYAFLKGAKRHLTNLAQLRYARLSVEAVENRINAMVEPLSFLQGAFTGEMDSTGNGKKKPAAVLILEQLKKEK